MFKITRFRLAVVAFIVLGAIFIDGYSYFYRAFIAHQWFPQKLTSTPSIAGKPIFIHKGLVAIGHFDPVPRKTVQTLRDDVLWAKEQAR